MYTILNEHVTPRCSQGDQIALLPNGREFVIDLLGVDGVADEAASRACRRCSEVNT